MICKTASPPKTPLAFHVGVTGHRALSPEACEAVAQSLALVVHQVRETATEILSRHPHLFSGTTPTLRCLSSLAEGADQLMAHVALCEGYELQAPLPFHREEYAKDFTIEEVCNNFETLLHHQEPTVTVFESDSDPANREAAYLQAGLLVLEHSDLLVAVWDATRKPRSMVGTARIVNESRQHNIPVLVIDPGNNGLISLDWHQPTASWQEALTRTMQEILCPFGYQADAANTFPEHYFLEQRPTHNFRGCLAAPFENILAGKLSRPQWRTEQSCPSLNEEWAHLGEPVLQRLAPQMARVQDDLDPHYHWADQLSAYYASRYRSLSTLRFLTLGLLLVGLLLGFYSSGFNQYGFALQVLGFGIILFLSNENSREECHQKFLDYRYLAEHLRHMRFLALLGRTMTAARIPTSNKEAASVWVHWHFRNIVRSMGLVPCRVNDDYLNSFRKLFIDGMLLEQKNCQGQVAFYADRGLKFQTIARRLDFLGRLFFWLGLAAICLRAVAYIPKLPEGTCTTFGRKLWNILALALPSLAPIFFGLKAQGEYDRIARRYQAMEQELRYRIERFGQLTSIGSVRLGQFAKDIAELLVEEVADWRILVRTKNIKPY